MLAYRGIDIHELAVNSTFEETTYLLWNGIPAQPAGAARVPVAAGAGPVAGSSHHRHAARHSRPATPMEVLRTAVSALSFYDADEKDNSHDANVRKSYNLTAQIAMIVAIYDRLRKGLEIVPPDRSLNHAANFLWMLNGVKPSETAIKTLDMALVLHAEHELNASTFAARVIAATLADVHSAITGAIGALKGPLHGGANEGVMRMLYAIDKAGDDPVEYVKNMLAARQKISGFGHRVYKTEDPRATHLRKMSEQLGKRRRHTQVVRDVARHRALYQLRQEAERQRGLLLGLDLRDPGHRHRPLYAHLRHQPHRRLGRPRDRAVGRQPPHPSPRRIHWPRLPRALHPHGRAGITATPPKTSVLVRRIAVSWS